MQISVAGASGDLGARVVRELIKSGASVKAIVRPGKDVSALQELGAQTVATTFEDADGLREACEGSECVVSCLSGTTATIIVAQSALLDAAVAAKVPRFIPSDFSIDYTRFERGRNRNFDLRRDFWKKVESSGIQATSIFNGAFAFLLLSPGFIDSAKRHVLFWGDSDKVASDYTTLDDAAAFTALAAQDSSAPCALHIASVSKSASQLAADASRLTGQEYVTFRCGSLEEMRSQIAREHAADPHPEAHTLPLWQAMQYAENMNSGFGCEARHDNDRYGSHLQWSNIDEILAPLRPSDDGRAE